MTKPELVIGEFPAATICRAYVEGNLTYSEAQRELCDRGLVEGPDAARMLLAQAVDGKLFDRQQETKAKRYPRL